MKIVEFIKKPFNWFYSDGRDEIVFSAFWAAFGLEAIFFQHIYFAPLIICGTMSFHHIRHYRHQKEVKLWHKLSQLECDWINELAEELGKAVGPKIPNDICRKHLQRIRDEFKEHDDDKKDPPSRIGRFFGKFATGEA
jgi:hypothetical protein